MDWHARVRAAFVKRPMPDDDVVEELAQHAADTWQAALSAGRSDEEALGAVDRQLAALAAEPAGLRRARRPPSPVPPPVAARPFAGLAHEVRYAVRLLLRQPGQSLAAVVTMALGLGAATVILSVLYGVLLEPLPWPDADRLVRLAETRRGGNNRFGAIMTNGTFYAWRSHPATVEGIAAWSRETPTLTDSRPPRRLTAALVTAGTFSLLRARPMAGRLLAASDEAPGVESVVVISQRLWQSQFASDPRIVGRTIRLDKASVRVVGVLADGFDFPDTDTEAWMPFLVPPPTDNGISIFRAIARLKPGVTPAQAAAEASARGQAAAGDNPGLVINAVFGSRGPVDVAAVPMLEHQTSAVRPAILVLLAAVALLLVTATANVANLQLARATGRRRDLAIRAAIGAGAARLGRQALVESLLLALTGGVAGLLLAALLQRALPFLLPPDFPRVEAIGLSFPVVLAAFGLALLSGVAFGVLPALQARRLDLVSILSEDGLAPVGGRLRARTARARAVLITAQVAIACLLLTGGALLTRSFQALLAADLGFRPEHVLTARLSLPEPDYAPARRVQVVSAVLEGLRQEPGVTAAGFTSSLPLGAGAQGLMAFQMPARNGTGEIRVQTAARVVSPGYAAALGLRLAAGRAFADADTRTSRPVVMVNRAFVREYLNEPAVGQQLPLAFSDGGDKAEIVGVVEDVLDQGATGPRLPELYESYLQLSEGLQSSDPTLTVRTAGDPTRLVPALRALVAGQDSSLALDQVATMTDLVSRSVARPRLYAVLLGGFAVLAVAIAGVGLFSILVYSVAQRTREIGVRAALGARPGRIVALVLRQAAGMVGIGLALGLGASLALLRGLSRLLYGVTPYDGPTYAAVAAVLIVLASVACVIPARRAAKMDPLRALRS
jgi:putative ABC transport system permease protein